MPETSETNLIHHTPQKGFHARADYGQIRHETESFERTWDCSADIGSGKFTILEIRTGFEIWITECTFHQKTIFSFQDHPSALAFSFCLSGNSKSLVGLRKDAVEICGGQQGIFYYPDPNGSGHFRTDIPFRQVSILIDPQQLLSYLGEDVDLLPPFLRDLLKNRCKRLFSIVKGITPSIYNALWQLVECPHRGLTRRLYLESRALELIARQLDQISAPELSRTIPDKIHPRDRNCIEIAKNLLLKDIENPPGLKELSRAAGMSHPKLNRCFLLMHGMTIFQYLRYERLKRAKMMLHDQKATVTETAYSVGYSSLSHFAKAYKEQFGVSPHTHLNLEKGLKRRLFTSRQ